MPRETWRDAPEYLGLWRMARQHADEPEHRFVLADWLEENGHAAEAWCERLHGLTGKAPAFDADTGLVRAGPVPMGQNAWARLLAAPPPDEVLCVFDRNVLAYRYLRQYRGRCGWDLGQSDWSSATERGHLMAVPRLEFLACHLVEEAGWDWIVGHLPGLTHLEASVPLIDDGRVAGLKHLPKLHGLLLHGVGMDGPLPGLRRLSIGPYPYAPSALAAFAPELEWLDADLIHIGDEVHWPRLRSLRLHGRSHWPPLTTAELTTLARHPLLERLDVRCGQLSDGAIEAVAELPRLRELTLRFENAPPPSLAALARSPALEALNVEGPMNDDRLAEVVGVAGLRRLSLDSVEGGRGLAGLAGMPQLEEVRLGGQCEYESALPGLARLPRLAKLDLERLKMAPKTARAVTGSCPAWVECLVPTDD